MATNETDGAHVPLPNISKLMDSAGTPQPLSIKVTESELDRHAREAPSGVQVEVPLHAPGAKIVDIRSIDNADYIGVHMSDGSVVPISRKDGFLRAKSVLDALRKTPPGATTRQERQETEWRCAAMLKACFKNGRDRGLDLDTPDILAWEKEIDRLLQSAAKHSASLGDV